MRQNKLVLGLLLLWMQGCGVEELPYFSMNAATNLDALVIRWNTPLQMQALGLPSDALLEGQSISAIVRSMVTARADKQLCSACHNANDAQGGYGMPVAPNATSPEFLPNEFVGTETQRPWQGSVGWAAAFARNKTKPLTLRRIFALWSGSDLPTQP